MEKTRRNWLITGILAVAMVFSCMLGLNLNSQVQTAYALDNPISASNVYYFNGYSDVSFGTTMPTGYTFSDGTLIIADGATPYEIWTTGSGNLAVKFEGDYGNNTISISNENGDLTLTSTTLVNVTLAGLYSSEMIHIEGKVNLTITGPNNAGSMDYQFRQFLVGCPHGTLYVENDASVTAIDPVLHGATLGESDFEAIFKVGALVLNTTGCFKVGLNTTPTSTDETYAIKVIDNEFFPITCTKCDNGFVLYSNANKFICEGDSATDPDNFDYQTKLETKLKTIEDGNSLTIRQCQVSFNANTGSGTMDSERHDKGNYSLSNCSFTAPSGQQFKCWAAGSAVGTQYNAGANYTIADDVTFYAIWEDAVDPIEVVSVGGNPVSAEIEVGEIVNGEFPVGHVGEAYSATLVAEGGSGNYTWSIVWGSLADGLTLNASTGVVSGTPTETATGYIVVRCVDASNAEINDDVNLTFMVASDAWIPSITTVTANNAVVGKSYMQTIQATVEGPESDLAWSVVNGSLPTGLNISKSGPLNGVISGTPTVAGTFNFTLQAENGFGCDTQAYTIVVDNPITISYPEGKYYLGDTIQFTASVGNSNVNWSMSGNASENTSISSTGLLTIGNDETSTSVTVYITSKTNSNNTANRALAFTNKVAYAITVIGGTATDSLSSPISRAAQGESVYIEAPVLDGKQFREWTVEDGSEDVTITPANTRNAGFTMLAGVAIVKANYNTIINEVSATFDAPVNGNHVDKTLTTGGVGYTATLNKIWTNNTWATIDNVVYATGESYFFFVTFAATDGYVLAGNSTLSVTLNGSLIDYDKDYTSNGWRIELIAVTNEIPHYAVTVVNGGADATLAEEGDIITITADAPSAGYVFDAWTTESGIVFTNANSAITTFTMPASAVTVTATYKLIPQYTVSFDVNGGSGTMVEQLVNEGATYNLPTCSFIAPANKEFKCWSVNDVERAVGYEIIVNANTTVVAVWQFITYTVSFDANGGTNAMANQIANKGSEYVLPTCTMTPPEGKEFKCWSVSESEMNVGDQILISGNVTVKAVWKDVASEQSMSDKEASAGINVKTLFDNAKTNGNMVVLNVGTTKVTFDQTAVNAIGGNTNITFTMTTSENVEEENIDGAQKVINITIDGFTAGTATVEVPFDTLVPSGKVAKVYYVDAQGNKTDMNATFANGKAIFTTTHFSKYAIVFEDEAVSPANNGGLSAGAIIGIIAGVLVLAGGAFCAYWFIFRKKKIAK